MSYKVHQKVRTNWLVRQWWNKHETLPPDLEKIKQDLIARMSLPKEK